MKHYCFIDFETRNQNDIAIVGLDNYVRTAESLMLGWAIDNRKVRVWFPASEHMPAELEAALPDPEITKIAWYAEFERNILRQVHKIDIPIHQFCDPMILARSLSLPGSLEKVCEIMKIGKDEAKLKDGKRLIKLFSEPNGQEGQETLFGVSDGFNNPKEYPQDFKMFVDYCIRDVEVERSLWLKMLPLSFPEEQWGDYWLSQEINETGLPVHVERVRKALGLAKKYKLEVKDTLNQMTGLANANSVTQLLPWLEERGYPWGSINKDFVDPELKNPASKLTPEAKAVLTLRRKSSQSSWNKLEAILNQVSPDGRLRHLFMYMGAARTGRWSSAGGINIQNMPRPIKQVKKMDSAAIFDLIDREAYAEIMERFDNSTLPFVASTIRMMFQVEGA